MKIDEYFLFFQDSIFNEKEAEVAELEKEKEKLEVRYNILLDFLGNLCEHIDNDISLLRFNQPEFTCRHVCELKIFSTFYC